MSTAGASSTSICNSAFSGPSIARLSPCAKLNLTLDVLGVRPDGFHELDSLVVGVDLCDTLTCKRLADPVVRFTCDDSTIDAKDNLCTRAAELFIKASGAPIGFAIKLIKRIPIGGGMGGGSCNAAGTLLLCNVLSKCPLSNETLHELGTALGSDVALFFHLPSALMRGRGEFVTPVSLAWSGFAVLAVAKAEVSTPKAYKAFDAMMSNRVSATPSGLSEKAILAPTARELADCCGNQLEKPVFSICPEVARVYKQLKNLNVGSVRVSGAGSVMYLLSDTEDEARCIARLIQETRIGVSVHVARVPVCPKPVEFEE